ncbi:FUSC family protein [Streptomyces sp. NPDC085665]|uniref:FUSC family protein n=1 Tax=Streptomyces sp. NPDC085665 TaxID=3365735 RepID=UPI0037D68F32
MDAARDGAGPVRGALRAVRDVLDATDPGLVRLFGAAHTVGAICLTLAVLWALGFGTPFLVAAGSSALVWSMVLTGPKEGEQAVTHALGLPVALLSATAAVLLAPYPVVSGAVFVVLLFVTVYVRRYGPRGTALGMNGFQMYFVMQFVPLPADQLPMLWAALAIAFACGAVVRFVLLRTSPARSFVRLRRSVRACLEDVAEALAALAGGDGATPRDRSGRITALRRRLRRLHTCALMLQDSVEACAAPDVAERVRTRMTETDVRAERLAVMLLKSGQDDGTAAEDFAHHLHLPGPGVRAGGTLAGGDALTARLRALPETLARIGPPESPARGGAPQAPGAAPARSSPAAAGAVSAVGAADQALTDFEQAAAALSEAFRWSPGTRPAAAKDPDAAKGPAAAREPVPARESVPVREPAPAEAPAPEAFPAAPPAPAPEEQSGLRRPTTRAAVQVACGATLATAGGQLISADHWYWAVLACWMVFFNTSSTGEIALKGSRRVAGTLAGALVGLFVASALAGYPWPAFVLTLVCVFGMAYTAALSYTAATFFITLMIALLSDLLGTYTNGLLLIRIAETVFGVLCGVAAAVVVLPRETGRRTDELLADALRALADAVTATARRLTSSASEPSPEVLVRAAHTADRHVEELARSLAPLMHPVAPHRARRRTSLYVLGLLETCAYHVRVLAVEAAREAPGGWSRSPAMPLLKERARTVADRLEALAAGRTDGERPPSAGARPGTGAPTPDEARVLMHFRRMDDDVRAMAGALPRPGSADPAPGGRRGREAE